MYQQHPTYAGWWRRVGAAIIDALIAWVFLLPGTIVAGGDSDAGTSLGPLLTIAGFVAYVVIYCRMLGRGATWGRQACSVGMRSRVSRCVCANQSRLVSK